jgi:hypothetical protein
LLPRCFAAADFGAPLGQNLESALLLDRLGTLEALAELAIRKAQTQPMRAIRGFKPRQR